jgi:uridine kinase
VGVAGGSAAGKTTLCENILRQMAFDRNFKVEIISLDSFYKSNNHSNTDVDKTQVDVREYNFDHPNALDFDLAYKTLLNLIESNEPVPVPQYSLHRARQDERPCLCWSSQRHFLLRSHVLLRQKNQRFAYLQDFHQL